MLRTAVLGAVSGLTLGMVAVVSTGSALADTPITAGPFHAKCQFPLIGTQTVDITGTTTLPDFKTGNDYKLTINTSDNVNLASVKGMWAAKAYTIEGTGHAVAKLFSADYPYGKDVSTDVVVQKKPITSPPTGDPNVGDYTGVPPEPTAGITLEADGTSPAVHLSTAGWAQINIESLDLTMTPKDYAGNPTSLGTFTSHCWLPVGQGTDNANNVLGQAYVDDGTTPKPPQPTPFNTFPPVRQSTVEGANLPTSHSTLPAPLHFMCYGMPVVGDQDIPVTMDVDYPTSVPTNTRAPNISINVGATISGPITQGLQLVQATEIDGTAISNNILKTPDYPNGVRAQTTAVLKPTQVPQTKPPRGQPYPSFSIPGTAVAPALVFDHPGNGSITIGDDRTGADPNNLPPDLVLLMTPHKADGTVTSVGTFAANCNLVPPGQQTSPTGQNTALFHWAVTQSPQTPGAPTLATPTVNGSSVTLNWTAGTTGDPATSYDVYSSEIPVAKSVTGTTTTLTGLKPGHYRITVRGTNSVGSSDDSNAEEFDVAGGPQAPTAPTLAKPAASDITSDSVKLTWTPGTGGGTPTGYDVYSGGQVVASSTTTSTTVTGLKADTDYTFTVKAKNDAGASGDSNAVTVHTGTVAQPPGKVTGVQTGTVGTDSVTITWQAPTTGDAPTKYQVVCNNNVVAETTSTSATVTGLTPDTAYTCVIRAVNATGSTDSDSFTFHTQAVPLAAPQNVKVGTVTSTTVALSWDPVDKATGYDVYSSGKVVASATTNSATVTGLAPDTDYTFTVRAKNASGASPDSTQVTAQTAKAPQPPAAPANLTAGTPTSSSVQLTWAASTGATGYDVYSAGKVVASVNAPAVTANVTGLQADTDYTFTVKAKNDVGSSPDSNAVKVHTAKGSGPGTGSYSLKGSSTIAAANGSVPLVGGVDASVDSATGKVTANLTLTQQTGNFTLFGFLPVTADVAFSQVGQTTGTLTGSSLTTDSKMYVKLPSVKLFGLQIGGGNACQTSTPTDVPLKASTFSLATGGTLTGSFTLPSLQGCGVLTPLLSAFAAGPGNQVTATLTPKS